MSGRLNSEETILLVGGCVAFLFLAFICFGLFYEHVMRKRYKRREQQAYGDRRGPPPMTARDLPMDEDGMVRGIHPGQVGPREGANPLDDFPMAIRGASAARPYSTGHGFENRPITGIPHSSSPLAARGEFQSIQRSAGRPHPGPDPPPTEDFVHFVRSDPDGPVYLTQSPPFKMSKAYTTTTPDGRVTGAYEQK
eukprot:TRINITY_DN25811_c0_g1_i1.p1 TRINITY_DN25811_c0_g1~~TRINITY_DN25811_c0_g1_i1.p1  ORF type:complete len:220 (+),score=67.78 TRINITY_DN25811_c0_g1_i1:78-662(+)